MAQIPTAKGNLKQEMNEEAGNIIRSNDLKTVIFHRIIDENTYLKMKLYSLVKRLDEEQRQRDYNPNSSVSLAFLET